MFKKINLFFIVAGFALASCSLGMDSTSENSGTHREMISYSLLDNAGEDPIILSLNLDGQITDNSGNGFTGDWHGPERYQDQFAVVLSSVDDSYITFPHNDAFGGMETLDISIRARKTDPDSSTRLINKHRQYALALDAKSVSGYVKNADGELVRVAVYNYSDVNDTDWHEYRLVYDGVLLALFVDGKEVDSEPFSGTVNNDRNYDLYIGKHPWRNAFDGEIDSVRISTFKDMSGAFVSYWDMSIDEDRDPFVYLPLVENGEYEFFVDWGDGSVSHIDSFDDPDRFHSYSGRDVYKVVMEGTIIGWMHYGWDRFDAYRLESSVSRNRIVEIEQWGTLSFGDTDHQFFQCSNLNVTASDAPDLSRTVSLRSCFDGCSSLEYLFAEGWDTSTITNMAWMFHDAFLFDGDLAGWDTSNVTSMAVMFSCCYQFDDNLSGWNTANVIALTSMFREAGSFNADLSNWDISKVLNMDNVFNGSGLSPENYSRILISWATLPVQDNIRMGASGISYLPEAEESRRVLIDQYGWTIIDGGSLNP